MIEYLFYGFFSVGLIYLILNYYYDWKCKGRIGIVKRAYNDCVFGDVIRTDQDYIQYVYRYYEESLRLLISKFNPWNNKYWSNEISITAIKHGKEIHLKLMNPKLSEPMWYIYNLRNHPNFLENKYYIELYPNKNDN